MSTNGESLSSFLFKGDIFDQLPFPHFFIYRVDLKVFVHYGASKASFSSSLTDQDVVLTTYGTLSAEFGMRQHSPLLGTKWLRVCLDEGHGIKNHRTKTAKAAANLDTQRRWIVSGEFNRVPALWLC